MTAQRTDTQDFHVAAGRVDGARVIAAGVCVAVKPGRQRVVQLNDLDGVVVKIGMPWAEKSDPHARIGGR